MTRFDHIRIKKPSLEMLTMIMSGLLRCLFPVLAFSTVELPGPGPLDGPTAVPAWIDDRRLILHHLLAPA